MDYRMDQQMDLQTLLKSEQQKFQAIFYGAESPLVIFKGPNFILEMLNEKYQSIYPDRELLGRPLFEAIPELGQSIFPEILKEIYETGTPYTSHEGLASIHNSQLGATEDRYFDTTFSRIQYGPDEVYRILAAPREVTDRVRARKKLEANLMALEQERDFRERFVASLTHDLRSPLTILNLAAQVLKNKAEHPDSVRATADKISASISRVDRTISDLLDAHLIHAGKTLPISTQSAGLDLIILKVMSDLEQLYGRRIRLPKTLTEMKGHWDALAIQRIIENLASNAMKYSYPNSLVTLIVIERDSWVDIAIHNEGHPIPADEQAQLFHTYHRTESAISTGLKGWGIGLTIVKGLAEAQGGRVQVESSAEKGTVFTVSLPIHREISF